MPLSNTQTTIGPYQNLIVCQHYRVDECLEIGIFKKSVVAIAVINDKSFIGTHPCLSLVIRCHALYYR